MLPPSILTWPMNKAGGIEVGSRRIVITLHSNTIHEKGGGLGEAPRWIAVSFRIPT